MTKTCTRCGAEHPIEHFFKNEHRSHSWCRACRTEDNRIRRQSFRAANPLPPRPKGMTAREWREANPERNAALKRRWALAHPDRRAGYKAAYYGAPGDDHTAEELTALWQELDHYACVFCGGPFEEVEHLIPISRGGHHSIGNLAPSCTDCNRGPGGKHTQTAREFMEARWLTQPE